MDKETIERGPDAVAFQAAAALESYEEHLLCACEDGCRLLELTVAESDLQHLRSTCTRLPQLRAPLLELLLSHSRLLAQGAAPDCAHVRTALEAGLQQHRECISSLRRHCRELFVAPHLR